jgi:hypothetical protein
VRMHRPASAFRVPGFNSLEDGAVLRNCPAETIRRPRRWLPRHEQRRVHSLRQDPQSPVACRSHDGLVEGKIRVMETPLVGRVDREDCQTPGRRCRIVAMGSTVARSSLPRIGMKVGMGQLSTACDRW